MLGFDVENDRQEAMKPLRCYERETFDKIRKRDSRFEEIKEIQTHVLASRQLDALSQISKRAWCQDTV